MDRPRESAWKPDPNRCTTIHSIKQRKEFHFQLECLLMEDDEACIFFKGDLILCTTEAGARSTLELLRIERSRAPVSLIRACPWACEENSNSYWSDQAGRPRGQDRPGQLVSNKQELFIT